MISVILPCYNEEETVISMIDEVARVLRKTYAEAFEIIVVNDGSTDQSGPLIKKAAKIEPRIRVIQYPQNRGKGYALKQGIKAARGRYTAFIDADLEIPPSLIPSYLSELQKEALDCVIGSKAHPGSQVHQSFKRRHLSRLSRALIHWLFPLPTLDTQVGLKVFRTQVAQAIIEDIETDRFAFDIEFLVLLQRQHCRIKSHPVVINQKDQDSHVGKVSILETLVDTFKIYRRLKIEPPQSVPTTAIEL